MKQKIIFLISTFAILSIYCKAQDTTKFYTPLNPNQVYLHNGCCFIYQNRFIPMADFKDFIKNNNEATLEYIKSIRNHKAEKVFAVSTILCFVGSLVTIGSENNLSGKFVAAGLVNAIFGGIFNKKTSQHLNKAVSIYNLAH